MPRKQALTKRKLADSIWARYQQSLHKGHADYQKKAKRNEDFYFGDGRQWDDVAKAALEAVNKPWLEENLIFSTINTVIGYQTQSRMDITYKPREDNDVQIADALAKVGMYDLDRNKYPWVEKQVFEDGIIQQRGYFDIRLDFDENFLGEIKIVSKDPLDIIPDQDAKSYDPDDWADVIETRWMSSEDIAIAYGREKSNLVMRYAESDPDFGIGELGEERNKFGSPTRYSSYYLDETDTLHSRILERQYWKLTTRNFWVDEGTGELEVVPDGMSLSEANKDEREIIKKLVKRIRWTVSSQDVILHDAWSPYEHFTITPYFPFFRRGVTLGLVDNLISTQQMLNKVYSQILHVINTTANSGWKVEQNSLTNMDTEDLEEYGAQSGIVIEYKPGRQSPEKIEPNQVPTGLKDMVNSGIELMQIISGVPASLKGEKGPEVTGIAIQSRVQQAATQLASPLDNLFFTRHLVAKRLLKLIQRFYTEPRVINVIGEGEEEENEQVAVNQEQLDGTVLNDLTVGKYDVVVADVPTQVTFQNSQFQEAVELLKYGVQVPHDEIVKLSSLSRKNEIAKKMSGKSPEAEQMQKAQMEGALEEMQKKIDKLEAEAKNKDIQSVNQATEAAQMIIENPAVVPIVEQLLAKTAPSEETEMPPSAPTSDIVDNQNLGAI